MVNSVKIETSKMAKIDILSKKSNHKKVKFFGKNDVLRTAWQIMNFEGDRYVKISLNGLFVKIGNFSDFKTLDELYPELRNVVDTKGMIVAKRKNRDSALIYVKHKKIMIPLG